MNEANARERTVPYYACEHGVPGGCAFCNATATPKPRAGEHTKGPWTMYANSPGDDALPSVMANNPQGGLFYVAQCNNKDHARRIVACVNACEGIPTASLELGDTKQWIKEEIALRAERDLLRERERELVEALEKIASCHSAFDGDVVSIAYKALAKHGR